jgi:glycosyltransferase involved in cell wall biosynthesis
VSLRISVIIATANPQPYVIRWALDSLARQTLTRSAFEVVIVDNNSQPPLDEAELCEYSGLPVRIVREPRQGVTFARCTGIVSAASELLAFLDDDNYIDPDYLAQSLLIAESNSTIGAFGGISRFLSEGRIPAWKTDLLPYVGVRDYGPEVITSNEDKWGPWEPIGAGMVFRRDIGLEFVRIVKTNPTAQLLGRRGKSFVCGEDSLLARLAYRLGYVCSYQPSLALTHMIKSTRLTPTQLALTVEGVARAYVIYEAILGRPAPDYSIYSALRELAARCRQRLRTKGWKTALVEWFWDVGYFRQARLLRSSPWLGGTRSENFHSYTQL